MRGPSWTNPERLNSEHHPAHGLALGGLPTHKGCKHWYPCRVAKQPEPRIKFRNSRKSKCLKVKTGLTPYLLVALSRMCFIVRLLSCMAESESKELHQESEPLALTSIEHARLWS